MRGVCLLYTSLCVIVVNIAAGIAFRLTVTVGHNDALSVRDTEQLFIAVSYTHLSFENERQKVEISLVKSIEQNERFGIGNNGEIKNISFGLFAACLLYTSRCV